MSSASLDIHPLIARLRDELAAEEYLTYQNVADQIGVSLRTVSAWMNDDITPQKRYRRQLADWLEGRNGKAA